MPQSLRGKVASSPRGPASPAQLGLTPSWHLSLRLHTVGEPLGEGRWVQGSGGLQGNKAQRRKAYPSTPCWSRLPCFLRTGSRPRDYVTSGGHGRWCPGLDTSNPAPTLTFLDVAPRPPLLWSVEHGEGWEATQTVVIHLNSHGQPGREEMPGPTQQQEVPARGMEVWALPSLPHSQQLSGHTA